jgi:exocyst complex component 2
MPILPLLHTTYAAKGALTMETKLLSHYKLDTLFPSEWPAEKDQEESSDDEALPGLAKRKSKGRYSSLSRNATLRGSVPGAERNKEGIENLVQKDEPDPLGGPQSVIQVLRQRGLPVEDDARLSMLPPSTLAPGSR